MSTELVAEQHEALERLVGTVVADKYRVDRLLGRGGMGAVFQATNLAIGKRVALKFLTRDAARDRDAAERFQREARAAGVVESAHIVQIFDAGTSADGLPFLVMELLPGEDLRARLQREKRLSSRVAANIAAQVLRALVRAHAAGIVHRDLKPDNIFLCQRDDDALFVKIVDFGISKLARSSTLDTLTRRGTVLGTAYYMSPEQAQAFDDVDGRTDLFSVGAILYECLVGRPPHVGPTYESVLIAICTKEAAAIQAFAPEVCDAFALVIHKALARERAQRFANALEFLEALLAALPEAFDQAPRTPRAAELTLSQAAPGQSTGSATVFASVSPERPLRRSPRIGSVVTALIAVVAGFGLTAFWMSRSARPSGEPVVTSQIALPTMATPAPPAPSASLPSNQGGPAGATSVNPPRLTASAAAGAAGAPEAAILKPKARVEARGQPPVRGKRAGVASGLELSTREP